MNSANNYKIWQVMSYQTSLILRDRISVEGVQEHQEMQGNNGNMCTYTILRFCSTHCYIATALAWQTTVARWPIMFRPRLLLLQYAVNVLCSSLQLH